MPDRSWTHGDTVRIRDERWTIARVAAGDDDGLLEVVGVDRGNLGVRATFLLRCEIVDPLPGPVRPKRTRRRPWRRAVSAALAGATPDWPALRTAWRAQVSLLPYQLEPALAVTRGRGCRLLIADEVGLGKTIEAGLVLAEVLARTDGARALVVTPAALREQWQRELHERFAIDAWVADAASIARFTAGWTAVVNPWGAQPAIIASIDFVKRPEVIRALEALVWDVIVFDEAHALGGRSDRAEAAALLAARARTVVLLTATPHNGDPDTFARLCRIGDVDRAFPLLAFRRTRADAGLAIARRARTLRLRIAPAERALHDALTGYTRAVWVQAASPGARLAMTVLVRRACSSAASLCRSLSRRISLLGARPDPPVAQMSLPLSGDEAPDAELAAPGLDDRPHEHEWLARLLALALGAAAAESKLRALATLVRRTREPVLVFTEYRDTLHLVAGVLHDAAPVLLHGGLSAAERTEAIRAFTSGGARLLIATDAASEGLNLHHRCRVVVNLELPWSPVRLEQRVGRVERIGQTRPVHALHLLAAGTAEEAVAERFARRRARAAGVLAGLRPGVTEQEIAAAVIGEDEHAVPGHGPEAFPHIEVPSLGLLAAAEAARSQQWRTFARPGASVAGRGAPVMHVPARRMRGTLLGFRCVLGGAAPWAPWDTLIGLHWPHRIDTDRLAAFVESPAVRAALEAARATLSARLAEDLDVPRSLLARREQAIVDTLLEAHGRLAAGLVQPGLFDRRVEHLQAAQAAVLDEALRTCRERLETGQRGPVADAAALAFALVER